MTTYILILTAINVCAAVSTIFLFVRVHLAEFKRMNEVDECKKQIQSLRGRIVGQERWDEVRIRETVDEYLGADGRDVGGGDDLASLMQVFAMLQGHQNGGENQENPSDTSRGHSSSRSAQYNPEDPPGLLGGNRQFDQSVENM